jgi:anaerobic dimethyl sulfoxide reductase subunit A
MNKNNAVSLLHAFAAARCNQGEDFPQIFMTIGAMGGHFAKPGHSCGSISHTWAANGGPRLVMNGDHGAPILPDPIDDVITAPALWESVLNGRYKRTVDAMADPTTVEERDIDIHAILHSWRDAIDTVQGAAKAIEVHRKVDFVAALAFSLNTSAKYSDIVLPISTQWERQSDYVYSTCATGKEILLFSSRVVEPLYEAKSDQWIGRELCKRFGLDEYAVYPLSEAQRYFNFIAGSTVASSEGSSSAAVFDNGVAKVDDVNSFETLVTITEDDLAWWEKEYGPVTGEPQEGKIALRELLEKGIYQIERHENDNYGYLHYQDFIDDPDGSPRSTKSGKFEIYSQAKADGINAMGYSAIKPYPSYIQPVYGYEQTFSDWENKVKGEYPYQVTNPHYLRRAHTGNDNLPWVREAMTNPVFINTQDAAAKGIQTGDTVLLTSPFAKGLRNACVTSRLMPGYVELPHGTWTEIDESTGIDKAGNDNHLLGNVITGSGVSGYNTLTINIEKYNGDALAPDYLWPQRIAEV